MNNPTIVVVAFNRLDSLKRLCSSLDRMKPADGDVNLVFSIDYNENKNKDVIEFAQNYKWSHGLKEVRVKEKNMGLKAHIFSCGQLTEEFGEIILLEDDLYVSPYFLEYTKKAQQYYKDEECIAGISLYHYRLTDLIWNHKLPFIPLDNDSDVYFMQIASSWGQSWNKRQWQGFKKWYDSNPDLSTISKLPKEIHDWPSTSWKRFFIGYLVETNKYFVFPRKSFSTNFNDPGTHYDFRDHDAQSPLVTVEPAIRFKDFKQSQNRYDAFFEVEPETIKSFNSELTNYDFDVDLYGTKRPRALNKQYVITTKKCRNSIMSFERSLKPHEMNVIYNVHGKDIALCRTEDILQDRYMDTDLVRDFGYFYRVMFNRRELTMFFKRVVKNKIAKLISRK